MFINIRSKDRDSGTVNNFRYVLGRPFQNVKRIQLMSCEIPHTALPIRSPYNEFSWTEDGTTYTCTVPEGSYTITSLLSALSSAMEAVTEIGCTFTASSLTNKITFLSLSTSITIVDSYLATNLGFVAGQSGNTFTSTNAYQLQPQDHYWSIQLKNIQTSYVSKKAYETFKIPVQVDFGYMIFYNTNSAYEQWADLQGQENIGHLDISLVDTYGNLVDLQGCEWSMLLKIC